MGPTMNGLENLLRLPTGCGEQNMLNFAPAVYVARYLDTVGQLNAEIRKKCLRFMQTGKKIVDPLPCSRNACSDVLPGYQREMTYQRADGSYSAFGGSDSCGSMWYVFLRKFFGIVLYPLLSRLTAFVVRSFGQADGLIGMSIDSNVQQEAIDFILARQSMDGSFPPVCKLLDKEMQGCSGGTCSLTAYVALALLEAGVSPKVTVKPFNYRLFV